MPSLMVSDYGCGFFAIRFVSFSPHPTPNTKANKSMRVGFIEATLLTQPRPFKPEWPEKHHLQWKGSDLVIANY